ncbi:hypothetical protein NVP1191O_59 [Vibrio phage 1.191.O._10N.286.52.B4]|nr:hypothetical protein NVP1191O_59 [Vibrio phage 1.191.O._10N.286.52.B4]
MNVKQWNASTNKEKAEYLLNTEVEIKSRTGMRADAKVNDPNPCVTVWTGHVGIVQITNQCDTSIDAIEQCAECLKDWKKELERCK